MSLTYGFFNSVDHDRVYDATQFGSIFNGVINDGVFQNIGDLFAVTPNEGMKIFVGTGRAWFNGTWTLNDSNMELTISESHPIYTRIDAIVLEVNHSSSVRANTIKIVEGTPSSSPVRPTLIDDEFQHQHPLAYVTILPNVSEITAADIQNVVGLDGEGCPFVTGILEVNSVDYLYSQWDAQFNNWRIEQQNDFEDWFQHLQDELDEHQAAHLQMEIDNLSEKLTTVVSGVLEAGETELTFSSSKIHDDSLVDLFIKSDEEVNPTGRYSDEGYVTFIFEEQETDLYCELRVMNFIDD